MAIGIVAALLGGMLFTTVGAAPAGAVTLNPVADTYVDSSSPSSNFGTRIYMRTDNSPTLNAYLRFDVQGAGPTAILRFFAETSNGLGVNVHTVDNNTWGETTTTFSNAPAIGPVIASTGPITAGTWQQVNVSSAITGNGLVSFALTSPSTTATRFTSREGVNQPQLVTPAPGSPDPYVVSHVSGSTYQAVGANGQTFTGTLKSVVQNAAADLEHNGGGTVQFPAGTFDLGSDFFKFDDLHGVTFDGAGMNQTIIQNNNSSAADTEPFNFTGAFNITVSDLTVSAGGAPRTTSDALDFDNGNDVVVRNVKITASRGRGIVFDGKNDNWDSLRNEVHDCVISGIPGDGIELLASSDNLVEGCTITNTGFHGIQLTKSSTTADQPNKKPNNNTISGNLIDGAGQDGVNVNSGDDNQITGNTIHNSSRVTSSRDGIRFSSSDSIACDDNTVANNVATDEQAPITQRYGLNIGSSLCHRTVVGPGQTFAPNLTGAIRDIGTGTIFQ
ncbi:MAG TPA: right-handed parallel beta-helix repeat-containing protein [Pilimelia sp.]|nr:right-handed parallel beta-helix repeat-containing protein [Pilimelia sp.]